MRPHVGLLLGMDFDGTLAPLARHPHAARLPEETRSMLRGLCRKTRVRLAVVSGRSLEDVRAKVGVSGIYYVGNHGLEMEGPGLRWTHPRARFFAARMQRAAGALERFLPEFPGAFLENKHYTLSVHYRAMSPLCSPALLRRRIRAALRGANLRIVAGNKVWEIRPRLRWDKGSALVELQRRLSGRFLKVFIGDDVTDEEAFDTLGSRAVTIRVSRFAGKEGSAALFELPVQQQVAALLRAVLSFVR